MIQSISQREVCDRFGSSYEPPGHQQRLGIALHTLSKLPLNALRHPAEHGTCGWYVWGGELSDDPSFFETLHVQHLVDYAPQLVPYLALEPGWRVLLLIGREDVWYDPGLLNV